MNVQREKKIIQLIGKASNERLERVASNCGPLSDRAEQELYLRNIDDSRIAQGLGCTVGSNRGNRDEDIKKSIAAALATSNRYLFSTSQANAIATAALGAYRFTCLDKHYTLGMSQDQRETLIEVFNSNDMSLLTPEAKTHLIGMDLTQLEQRVAATPTKKDDPHTTTAASLYGIPEDRVTDEQRRIGKSLNYLAMYSIQGTVAGRFKK